VSYSAGEPNYKDSSRLNETGLEVEVMIKSRQVIIQLRFKPAAFKIQEQYFV
jgi:hypothetical protein